VVTANDNGVRQLVQNGLQAVLAAADKGKESAAKIMDAATSAELKRELARGTEVADSWLRRAEAALQTMRKPSEQDTGVLAKLAHTAQQVIGASDNHIIEAIYVTGREITTRAEDETSRDLGIISTGQLALHYYIAAFGSLASYADALGEQDVARTMKQCAEEAKAEDERHTELARHTLTA
jgi:ferritin-like metal-binding protein YciE